MELSETQNDKEEQIENSSERNADEKSQTDENSKDTPDIQTKLLLKELRVKSFCNGKSIDGTIASLLEDFITFLKLVSEQYAKFICEIGVEEITELLAILSIGNTGMGNTGMGNTGIGNTGIGNTGIGSTGMSLDILTNFVDKYYSDKIILIYDDNKMQGFYLSGNEVPDAEQTYVKFAKMCLNKHDYKRLLNFIFTNPKYTQYKYIVFSDLINPYPALTEIDTQKLHSGQNEPPQNLSKILNDIISQHFIYILPKYYDIYRIIQIPNYTEDNIQIQKIVKQFNRLNCILEKGSGENSNNIQTPNIHLQGKSKFYTISHNTVILLLNSSALSYKENVTKIETYLTQCGINYISKDVKIQTAKYNTFVVIYNRKYTQGEQEHVMDLTFTNNILEKEKDCNAQPSEKLFNKTFKRTIQVIKKTGKLFLSQEQNKLQNVNSLTRYGIKEKIKQKIYTMKEYVVILDKPIIFSIPDTNSMNICVSLQVCENCIGLNEKIFLTQLYKQGGEPIYWTNTGKLEMIYLFVIDTIIIPADILFYNIYTNGMIKNFEHDISPLHPFVYGNFLLKKFVENHLNFVDRRRFSFRATPAYRFKITTGKHFSDDDFGYIYLVKTSNAPPNTYKIGKTTQNNPIDRFNQYGKGLTIILLIRCINPDQSEIDLIHTFRNTFTARTAIGAEYFEGNITKMIEIICKYILSE